MANDGEVRLRDLMALLDKARRPVDAAYKSDEACPIMSFDDVREPLRAAYRLLDGDPDVDFKERGLQGRRTVPLIIAHFSACLLAQLAQQAIADQSGELDLVLLAKSRELVRILERHVLGEEPATGKNVVAFKAKQRAAASSSADVA